MPIDDLFQCLRSFPKPSTDLPTVYVMTEEVHKILLRQFGSSNSTEFDRLCGIRFECCPTVPEAVARAQFLKSQGERPALIFCEGTSDDERKREGTTPENAASRTGPILIGGKLPSLPEEVLSEPATGGIQGGSSLSPGGDLHGFDSGRNYQALNRWMRFYASMGIIPAPYLDRSFSTTSSLGAKPCKNCGTPTHHKKQCCSGDCFREFKAKAKGL